MIINIRLIPVVSCFITVLDEVRTITNVAGPDFTGIVIPICMNAMNIMA